MTETPGSLVFFGSMELTSTGRAIHDWLWRQLQPPIRVAVLETPAGFELNSADVAGRYADFMKLRLQQWNPQIDVVPARKKGTPFSPDDPDICAPILEANEIYLGAGSPSYTVRQLADSLAWQYVLVRHRLGAAVCFESAATVAAGRYALPVYEIYKVGEDIHWKPGLDLFGSYGLPIVFVPHWNNNDGGSALDTSHCYVGRERFLQLRSMLTLGTTVVGVDDHTALVVQVAQRSCQVLGDGGVTIDSGDGEAAYVRSGESFPITWLGPFHEPADDFDLAKSVWAAARSAKRPRDNATDGAEADPPPEILELVEEREQARRSHDWAASDRTRESLLELGWQVDDAPEGPRLRPRGQPASSHS